MKPVSSDRLREAAQFGPTALSGLAQVRQSIVSCERCPRLRSYCRRVAQEKKRAHMSETYWGRPVPGFGDPDARLLLVGLAPAAHGANRTGRPFTGDGSGDFLMSALHRTGFANIATSRRVDDGLRLNDAYIVSAVRCAPPDNTPLPEEITRCLNHVEAEVGELRRIQVVVALGKIAFDAWLRLMKRHGAAPSPRPQFGHGVIVRLVRQGGPRKRSAQPALAGRVATRPDPGEGGMKSSILIGCYHPSRQNTNTGKLTPRMIESVFRKARRLIDATN